MTELRAALERELRGEVDFSAGTQAVYATDSSNYRHVPICVLFPHDHADVVAALRICAAFDVPVLGRGAGTSLAGQTCNEAVVLDFSRHMNAILDIDPVQRTATVQPGVVLDDLRRAAQAHGLTFGPDPATHAWCTLGGMIGNNSCGTHALYAGKTVDNVRRLRVVAYGGAEYEFGDYDDAGYARVVREGAPEAAILGSLREIGRRYEKLVMTRFPDIPRRVSGYNLDQLIPGRPLHAARLLVGTESTCVLVTEAVLTLTPSPAHRRLALIGYPSIFEAADAVPDLLGILKPGKLIGLEGFDVTLVRHMRERGLNLEHLPMLPGLDEALENNAGGWLLAEIGADSAQEADQAAAEFLAGLPAAAHGRHDRELLTDPARQRGAWAIRESGLGATALRSDGGHNVEGWEDGAVPPEHLGGYLRGISALWKEFGYDGAWYGHFGQGCVHTRNNFDLHTAEGLAKYRLYVELAAELVVGLGGSLSGEHGDGQARGELLERMYGPELVDAFRQVKAVFDPRGRMNPGKVVDPYPLDANLRYGPDYRPGGPITRAGFFPLAEDRGSLQRAAERCVGVGRCRRDDTGVMCPSFRATRDERHSTRGRAKLLVEMFQRDDPDQVWRNTEIREALDLCLSCKGCAVDCPTHVDMATYKSEFMARHYRGRLRPRAMYALALTPWLARIAAHLPRLANLALTAPVLSTLVRRLAGVTTRRPAPRFAERSLRRQARSTGKGYDAGPGPHAEQETGTVVLWPDTFTDAYRPDLALAWKNVFESIGEQVVIPTQWACCARPLYDAGMLDLARRTLTRLLDVLDPYLYRHLPIVVVEPSCLAAFRDELPKLLADDPRAAVLAALAQSPAEFLLAGPGADLLPRPATRREVAVHPHCHARAAGSSAADGKLLAALGHQVTVVDAGCCGLAGSFGFDADHEALSRKIGTEQWLPGVRATLEKMTDGALVVDGFSCATQYSHLDESGQAAMTLVELIQSGGDGAGG
ncbi:MAG TPA: FAD-binding and (Fe-S)-binding domain-containing protein [Actinocrinis sp.]|nr:FAD-binding and (Fe-S)-binding domain-containing protein [Actinocrinis sp.]